MRRAGIRGGTARLCGGVLVVVAVALGGAGGAPAGERSGPVGANALGNVPSERQAAIGIVISRYLGLTDSQIVAELRAGKTLADIANALPGKSAAGLVGAIVAAVKAQLDRKVAAGKLTAAKEAELLAPVRRMAAKIVHGAFSKGGRP